MKIAQIAPLMESVPPRLYGGTERIVSYLTDELVRLGHEVTLFSSTAKLSPATTTALPRSISSETTTLTTACFYTPST
jgi:hypothetical protein